MLWNYVYFVQVENTSKLNVLLQRLLVYLNIPSKNKPTCREQGQMVWTTTNITFDFYTCLGFSRRQHKTLIQTGEIALLHLNLNAISLNANSTVQYQIVWLSAVLTVTVVKWTKQLNRQSIHNLSQCVALHFCVLLTSVNFILRLHIHFLQHSQKNIQQTRSRFPSQEKDVKWHGLSCQPQALVFNKLIDCNIFT